MAKSSRQTALELSMLTIAFVVGAETQRHKEVGDMPLGEIQKIIRALNHVMNSEGFIEMELEEVIHRVLHHN